MTGLWVALSKAMTAVEIRALLEAWFPELVVVHWDLSSRERAAESLADPLTAKADILFTVEAIQSEFLTAVRFDLFPGPQDEAVVQPTMIALGRMFAEAFDCRTICDGSAYGDDDGPFWDIIWEGGRSYLADDCDSAFINGVGGPVKIVRQLHLPRHALDPSGRLVR